MTLCGGSILLTKCTDSPTLIVTSAGSKTKLPPEPIWTSTAHAGVAKNSVVSSTKTTS